jgi:hydrogenase expression/formation protein HypC
MLVTEITDDVLARCQVGEGNAYITASLLLLPEPPRVGDYVIVHAGFALHIVSPEEAEESLRLLRRIADGGDLLPSLKEGGGSLVLKNQAGEEI